MSKRIREFIFVTSLSFTLVSMINAVFNLLDLSTIITPWHTLSVFFTCSVIAFLITIGDLIPYVNEHLFIYNYTVVLIVALGINTILLGHFYWQNFILQIVMLTIVYFGVYFGAYGIHCKQALIINKKLDETHKRNEM